MRRATIFRLAILCAAIAASLVAAYRSGGVDTGGSARVIVQMAPGHASSELNPVVAALGGTIGRTLDIINASVVELPLARSPRWPATRSWRASPRSRGRRHDGADLGDDRRHGDSRRARLRRPGRGVAIIDSGVTPWHDDLASGDGGQRVVRFVDFVRNRSNPCDDYGHGSHVAGVIAGNGFDSRRANRHRPARISWSSRSSTPRATAGSAM